MRPPEAPIGWPSATAPPLTFTRSGSAPSILVELSTTEENASFSSTRSTSSIFLPAFSSALAPAFAGVRARYAKSSATYACETIVASGSSARPFVRAQRPQILALARNPELTRHERRVLHHVLLVERGREPIVGHQVDQRPVAEPVPEARLLEDVRRVRHRLHAAGHDHVVVAGADHRVGDLHCSDRRRADLVDRVGGDLDRQAGPDRRLTGRRLPGSALENLAHDHVLDLVVREAYAVEPVADHERAELGRLVAGEAAPEPAEGRADCADDHRPAHRCQPSRGARSGG